MISIHEKLIFGAIISAAIDKTVNLKFTGTNEQIAVVQEVVSCLRNVNHVINEEKASIKTIVKALQQKHEIVKKFEKCFGLKWPSNI